MTSSGHSPLHQEISALALFISIRQLIASPIIVGVTHLIHSDNVFLDVWEILDFLVISFPLTLSVAILFVVIAKGKFNMFTLIFAVAGAALLSNLLHWVVSEIPAVDVNKTLNESFNYNDNRGGNSAAIAWVINIFGVYWKTFGAILFIQSCCIGIYAGYKYLKIEESKNAKKKP
jgi:hypothetical protein